MIGAGDSASRPASSSRRASAEFLSEVSCGLSSSERGRLSSAMSVAVVRDSPFPGMRYRPREDLPFAMRSGPFFCSVGRRPSTSFERPVAFAGGVFSREGDRTSTVRIRDIRRSTRASRRRQHPGEVPLPERRAIGLRGQPNQAFRTETSKSHRTGDEHQVADELLGGLISTARVFGHHLTDDHGQVFRHLPILDGRIRASSPWCCNSFCNTVPSG